MNGHRAYDLRRNGADVELKPKHIRIDSIELMDFSPETMQATIRVACGKGTYIRALARDIGRALQSGAYLTQLCRTKSGDSHIENCLSLDTFEEWLAQQTIETDDDAQQPSQTPQV